MEMEYFTLVRAGTPTFDLVDLEGNVVCQGKQQLKPMVMPGPGVAEHPDDDLWDSIIAASRQALERFTEDPASIVGMGLWLKQKAGIQCIGCIDGEEMLSERVKNFSQVFCRTILSFALALFQRKESA